MDHIDDMKFLGQFIDGCFDAALANSTDSEGVAYTSNYTRYDFTDSARKDIVEDCKNFWNRNKEDIRVNAEQAGWDFWLTRSRDVNGDFQLWPPEIARRLTKSAKEFDIYNLGENGTVIY